MIKMKNKLLIGLMFCLVLTLFIGQASADYLPHKVNSDLKFSITSNFADECLLSTIDTPSDVIVINQLVQDSGTFTFLVSKDNYQELGVYRHNIICNDGVDVVSDVYSREITPNGEINSAWKISLEIFASISTLFLMGLFLFLSKSGLKDERTGKEERPIIRFFFVGVAFIFLIAHILITSIVITNNLGEGTIANVYSNVMYAFFTIIILIFLYILWKVSAHEIEVIQRRKGLK